MTTNAETEATAWRHAAETHPNHKQAMILVPCPTCDAARPGGYGGGHLIALRCPICRTDFPYPSDREAKCP